jgi:hypothetical protein
VESVRSKKPATGRYRSGLLPYEAAAIVLMAKARIGELTADVKGPGRGKAPNVGGRKVPSGNVSPPWKRKPSSRTEHGFNEA